MLCRQSGILISASWLSWIIAVCAFKVMICSMWATFVTTFRTHNHTCCNVWQVRPWFYIIFVAIIAIAIGFCNWFFFLFLTKNGIPVVRKLFLAYAKWSWDAALSAVTHLLLPLLIRQCLHRWCGCK